VCVRLHRRILESSTHYQGLHRRMLESSTQKRSVRCRSVCKAAQKDTRKFHTLSRLHRRILESSTQKRSVRCRSVCKAAQKDTRKFHTISRLHRRILESYGHNCWNFETHTNCCCSCIMHMVLKAVGCMKHSTVSKTPIKSVHHAHGTERCGVQKAQHCLKTSN